MRKTKIICTIGPASENEETLTQMCLAGMNVARLNFSHGSYEEHQNKIDLIKRVREKLNIPLAIMLDTKGPEYRIGTFENGKVEVQDGAVFTFTIDDIVGDATRVSVNYKDLIKNLSVGDRIMVNNGLGLKIDQLYVFHQAADIGQLLIYISDADPLVHGVIRAIQQTQHIVCIHLLLHIVGDISHADIVH